MKEFRACTFDYSKELHRDVIVDCEDFNTKEDALKYAKTVKQTSDSTTIITGDYGYTRIAKITRSGIKIIKL